MSEKDFHDLSGDIVRRSMNQRALASAGQALALALALASAALGGCTVAGPAGAGGNGPGGAASSSGAEGGGGSTEGGAGAPGDVAPRLVGIWQETAASGGDFTNTATGESFTVSQGYSARLKIRADGSYSFEHYSAGVSSSCASVTAYDKSVGAAEFHEGRLVLRPTQRTLDVRACADSGTRTVANDPIEFAASVSSYETLIKETTLQVELTAGPYPLKLKLLQLDPTKQATQPPRPAGFQLGQDAPYGVLVGTWAPLEADVGFYEPSSGAFYVPKYNGSEHKWLRFTQGGYELASVLENAAGAGSGVCKKDLVYWEKGTATFATLTQTNDTYRGDSDAPGRASASHRAGPRLRRGRRHEEL